MKRKELFKVNSIKLELVVPLISAFLVATIIITSVVLYHSKKMVEEVMVQLKNQMVSIIEMNLDSKLSKAIQLSKINYDSFNNDLLLVSDTNKRERYFSTMIKNFDDVAMTYVGLENGEFYGARRNLDNTFNIVRNNKSTGGNSEYYEINSYGEGTELVQIFKKFDPRVRPWYLGALKNKDITFSSIYSHFVFKEPTITASMPIYKGEEVLGVVGVDFLLTWLGGVLRELPIGEHGEVFILDEKESLVATTVDEEIFKMDKGLSINIKASESKNFVTKSAVAKLKNESNKKYQEIEIGSKKYLLVKEKLKFYNINWDIFIVILIDDFLGETKIILLQTLISVSIVSLLFMIITLMVIKHIVNPILKLNESAKHLASGIYEEVPLITDKNELYELTNNFNLMGNKLTNLLEHLSEEVRLRTAELEEKNEILNKLSYIDELMQIPNRRKFDEYGVEVLDLASRNKRPIGFMMMDIDDFKKYNDTYGHIAGDNCLKKIGEVLRKSIQRKTDLVARYGGEEIAVIIQETTLENIVNIAEKIRINIEKMDIEHKNSNFGKVTISIGVVYGQILSNQRVEDMVQLADEMLYKAKRKGKNRCEVLEKK